MPASPPATEVADGAQSLCRYSDESTLDTVLYGMTYLVRVPERTADGQLGVLVLGFYSPIITEARKTAWAPPRSGTNFSHLWYHAR